MTREEAVARIRDHMSVHKIREERGVKITEALNMAISALEQLPSAQSDTARRIIVKSRDGMTLWYECDMCNAPVDAQDNFCRGCGRRLIDEKAVKNQPSVTQKAERRWNPCDWCAYNPPSSMDGKPCTLCPAVANPEPFQKEGGE